MKSFEGLYRKRDKNFWLEISRLKEEYALTDQIILENFVTFARRREIARFLAYYHLFNLALDVPGSFVELGVYLGNGLFTWAKLLETFAPATRGRLVYGFDRFDGYHSSIPEENEHIKFIHEIHGHNFSASEDLVSSLINNNETDNLIAGVKRIHMYSGDVTESVDRFKSENPGVRVALLMLDLNLYEPTKTSLEKLFPLVPKGGVVCFRGYGVKPWEGESLAVDEFLTNHGQCLKTLAFSPDPAAYFIRS